MAKPSRNEYLNQRVQLAQSLGRDINVKIPTNPTKAQLTALDAQINKILYPSGNYGDTTSQAELDRQAAARAEAARQAELEAQKTAAKAAETAEKRQSVYDFIKTQAETMGIGVGIADRIIDLVANQGYSSRAVDLVNPAC